MQIFLSATDHLELVVNRTSMCWHTMNFINVFEGIMKVYLLCISVVAVPLWQTLNEPIPDSNTINVCIKYYIIK